MFVRVGGGGTGLRYNKRGFTILELLVVMAIIAILGSLGFRGYSLARRQAKESHAKSEIEKLRNALEEYRVEYGRYPQQQQPGKFPEMAFLTNAVEGLEWVDPWGNPYHYVCTNRFQYHIWSEGQESLNSNDNIDPSKAGY